MKLIKEINSKFGNQKIYYLGDTNAFGWSKKILIITENFNGFGSKVRYRCHIHKDKKEDIIITRGMPYKTKLKNIDY